MVKRISPAENPEIRRLLILATLGLLLFGGVWTTRGSFLLVQIDSSQPSASPGPSPSPSPSPSPTPITGLHQWGAITLFHGLPSDRVHAITQSNDGTMWFGTESGLAKFDGRRTQVIKDAALPGSRILSLMNDSDDALWIGTESGAARMTNGQIQEIKETSGNVIDAIISPEPGRMLFATEQGNVFEARTRADGSLQVQALLKQPLQSADADHPGPLAITSLAVIDGKIIAGCLSRGLLIIENGIARESPLGRNGYFIRSLAVDSENKLWIGTRSKKEEPGIFSGELNGLKRNEAGTGPVMTIKPIGADVLVGTDGRGVFRFAKGRLERLTFEGTAGGLRSDHVFAIFVDREDVIWFGTDRGVCRFDPNAPRVDAVGANAESNFVRTILRASGGELIAGTNRGLFFYNETMKGWEAVDALSRNIIYSLAEDEGDKLLVGSASGLYLSDRALNNGALNTLSFARLEVGSGSADATGSIRAIAHFRGAIFLANFGRGVEQLQNAHVKNVWPREAPTDVISLFADGDRRLIVGTAKDGILFFDGQQTVVDPAFDQFKGTAVRSVTRTKDGTLWVATARGVYACRADNQCTATAANVDGRSLSASEYSNNAVWCATTGTGLLKITLDKEIGPIVSQLDVEQGLPTQNTFAVVTEADDRELLLGTSRGVVRYGPGQSTPTLLATRIVSKRVHQPSELAGGLNLEYPQNSLLVDVGAISSRTFPEQFQYAFLLSDSKGQVIRQRISRESQFAMEGLKSGHYRVTVRAFTKDLIASGPLSFEFNVAKAPFPWTSTALAILLTLTLFALLWALLERRRIVRTSAELGAANRELAGARLDLANEAERERGRIARDLHDQTLADLRHLLLLTDQISGSTGSSQGNGEGRAPNVAAGELRNQIEGISQEVRRICEDLSPSVLQNVGFSAALEFALSSAVQHAPANCRFTYEFVCDEAIEEKTNLPSNVQMQIYRIAQEAVNNICRHASPHHVKMEVRASPVGEFILKIEDDGLAFNGGDHSRVDGRGLANMRARASLIEAEISWSRREGGGTIFTLKKNAVPVTHRG